MEGPGRGNTDYKRMATAELEELLLQDFHGQGVGDADALFRAAAELARREPSAGDAGQAWESFREKYLPFCGKGGSLYEDAEPPDGSDAAVKPRHPGLLPGRRQRPSRRGLGRFAAAVLLAALLGGGLLLTVDQAARAAFAGWVRELYQGYFYVYNYQGHDEGAVSVKDEMPACYLTWMPEGYVLEDIIEQAGGMILMYSGPGDGLISLQYTLSDVIGGLYIDSGSPKRVMVQGEWGDFYQGEEAPSCLIWEDGETKILFCLSAEGGEELLLQIAEGVETCRPIYRPTWVPEEYRVFSESAEPHREEVSVTIVYEGEGGGSLLYRCQSIDSSTYFQAAGGEGMTVEQVQVNGLPGDLYLDAAPAAHHELVWTDETNGLVFTINGSLSREELLQMAGSVQPMPPEQPPYRPTWIPAGYTYFRTSGGLHRTVLGYWDSECDRETAVWFCHAVEDREEETLEELRETTAGLEPREAQVGEYPAQLWRAEDGTGHLAWSGRPGEIYWIYGPISDGELIRMAEGVRMEP